MLDGEDAINALAAGWDQQDSVVAVTRGALERLTRDELQGVVAHEFAHILNGDTRLNMRLIGMVFGLQMVFNFGRGMMRPTDRGRRGPHAGGRWRWWWSAASAGWPDACSKPASRASASTWPTRYAVQFTRQPTGIGNALRKVAGQLQRGQRMRHVNAEVVSHLCSPRIRSCAAAGWRPIRRSRSGCAASSATTWHRSRTIHCQYRRSIRPSFRRWISRWHWP